MRECFPRLSYCISDIVVLVGVDKLYSSRYLERALLFAKQANTNIQDVELPVLIIINNKEDVDACDFDIKATSLCVGARRRGDDGWAASSSCARARGAHPPAPPTHPRRLSLLPPSPRAPAGASPR